MIVTVSKQSQVAGCKYLSQVADGAVQQGRIELDGVLGECDSISLAALVFIVARGRGAGHSILWFTQSESPLNLPDPNRSPRHLVLLYT